MRVRFFRAASGLLAARILVILLILAALQFAVTVRILSPLAVAAPSSVIAALGNIVVNGQIWTGLGLTLINWLTGVALAALIGIPLGLALGGNEVVYAAFRVPIEFMRTVPAIAIMPLALLLLGVTARMAILLVFIGALWPILLQSMYGFHQIDAALRDVSRSYRIRRSDRFTRIILPTAAPFVATGLRISLTVGLLLAVSAEVIAGVPGLGNEVALAQQNLKIPEMYAFVVVIACVGTIANLGTRRLERQILSWHPAHRKGGNS
ncbi:MULTISPECIES: ABC transporter permease [unclassified Microbacterium]|uniref:ABC transporter permease n=1 Tax=unclassified Microbacterium TaxID=2609290 RepID=UPI003669ED07